VLRTIVPKPTMANRLITMLVFCGWATTSMALDPPHLDEMPEIPRVLADMRGSDLNDSYARQAAAMHHLAQLVLTMAGNRRYADKLTDDENQVYRVYMAELIRLQSEISDKLNPTHDPANQGFFRWSDQFTQYRGNTRFAGELIQRYFSPAFIAQYQATVADASAARRAEYRPPRDPMFGDFGKRWKRMTPDERTGAILFASLMIVILGLVVAAEFMPFGIHPDDPHKIRAGLRRYRLDWATGTFGNYVRREDSRSSTQWMNIGAQDGPPGENRGKWVTSTTNWLTEEFSLVGPHGTRDSTVVSSYGSSRVGPGYFSLADGHEMTAAWVSRRRGKFVGHLLFYDWSRESKAAEGVCAKTISKLRGRRHWTMIPAWGLGIAVGSSTDIPLGSIWGAIVFWILWRFVFNWFRNSRERQFLQRDIPRLIGQIRREDGPQSA
jgi:hypothetical protein